MKHDEAQRANQLVPGTDEELPPKAAELADIFNERATSRLLLRRLQSGDSSAVFAVHGDPATNRYNPAGSHLDLTASEEMLRACLQRWDTDGFGYWAILLPQEKRIIGFGGIEHQIWRDRDVLNLYYRLTPDAWGHGYATELATTAVTLARKHLPTWPVIARTRSENLASIRTAERAGLLRRPDLDTEHVVFALGWPT